MELYEMFVEFIQHFDFDVVDLFMNLSFFKTTDVSSVVF